jgi:site-specific DNA recombinase
VKRAAIYCRISRDPEGLRAGVDRQEEDARALATRQGYDVAEVYVDNDVSASTLSRKARPQYEAMMDAARRGQIAAIVAYSNSRLTRRLRELEDLLDLHDKHGVKILTVVSGSDDLATADGRMTARIKASVDAAEAERAGERIARAHLQRAREGKVNHGARPFGWAADKIELDPFESALIKQAVTDIIDGVAQREIARRWNAEGALTARGNRWDHRAVRQLLRGPRLAGWKVHRGQVVKDSAGRPVKGVWKPIISATDYERLQVALAGRHGRSTGRRGARRYLLSGVARCGVCGSRMYAAPTKQGHAYQCRGEGGSPPHTMSITGVGADETVSEVVVARLRQVGDLDVPPVDDFAGADRLTAIPKKISELMAAYNDDRLSAAIVFPQIEALEAEVATLGAARQKHIVATTRPSHIDVETFDSSDIDRRRAIIEELLEAVVVAPSHKGARWDPDRITYVWRTDKAMGATR